MIFKERQYFPMLLGNGTDSVLIDWSGSMRACDKGLEHVERNWYKSDRRDADGRLRPHFFTGYLLTYHNEQHLIRESEQEFDPYHAMLHTKVQASGFEVEIETFMTNDHLLVQHFTFCEVPADDSEVGLELILSRPATEGVLLGPDCSGNVEIVDEETTLQAEYNYGEQNGLAFLLCSSECCHGETGAENGSLTWSGAVLKVANIQAGSTLSSYFFVGDNRDYPDPAKAAETVKTKIRQYGYEHIRQEHLDAWTAYHNQSSVKTGDEASDYLIMLSNYLLKIYQNPVSGAASAGLYPFMWQGKVFWDSFFFHEAMLRGNHIDEAEKLSLFWLKTLPQARKNAGLWKRKYGSGEGARYGWCTDHQGTCELITEIKELHNNPIVAVIAWNQFRYSRNREILNMLFPVMKEAIDFMLGSAIVEQNGKAYIANCEGVDESTRNHNCNDTWTAGAMISALSALIKASGELDIELPGLYSDILHKLSLGLQDNHNENGILCSSLYSTSVNFGSMIYLLLPEYPSAYATMQELWHKRGKYCSVCQIGTPRQDARCVPWFQSWSASVWAQLQDKRACEYLSECRKNTNCFGAFPEQVRPDGSLYKHWMGTAHACFLMAVYRILADVRGDSIKLGFSLPENWLNMEFSNIRLSNGLIISCSLKQGEIKYLQIENPLAYTVNCNIESGPDIKPRLQKQILVLKPGQICKLA